MAGDAVPNPGSAEAGELGCSCAVLDNNHGRFPPVPPDSVFGVVDGGWWITEGCPVHAPDGRPPDGR